MLPRQLLYTILLVCMPLIAAAEDMTVQNGDDTFVSGDTVLLDMDSSGDLCGRRGFDVEWYDAG